MASTKTIVIMISAMMMMMISATMVLAKDDDGGDDAGCSSVVGPLQPCLDFLRGQADMPSPACCEGAKELDASAKTTKQRQDACKCIKDAMSKIKNIDDNRIPQVPEKCKIKTTLPPIGPGFDCSTITSESGPGFLFNSY